jgi:peptidoglycan/xylan/chitin deacetylase (PgdA/CDA1 family)
LATLKNVHDLYQRARASYARRASQFFFKRLFTIRTDRAIISFTFDDFPRSALQNGGAILRNFGLSGTYYAAFGLMARQTEVGAIFLPRDLKTLLDEGHELGCHTFDHCDSANTNPAAFENSIVKNQMALKEFFPDIRFQTFSYPRSAPQPLAKKKTEGHFVCCRGWGQIFNSGTVDLNYLSAYFLENSRNDPGAVKRVIDDNIAARGWLIFATHDISHNSSQFGCSPEFFSEIVEYAAKSGARVLPVVKAWQALNGQSRTGL